MYILKDVSAPKAIEDASERTPVETSGINKSRLPLTWMYLLVFSYILVELHIPPNVTAVVDGRYVKLRSLDLCQVEIPKYNRAVSYQILEAPGRRAQSQAGRKW